MVRDGRDADVVPEEVVRGDVVRVRPGDQVVVDGPVLEGAVEVDESLLTGESEALRKTPGEDLLSGSHCVGGAGLQLARDVGRRQLRQPADGRGPPRLTDITPLQRRIAFVIRLTMVLVVLMGGAILLQAALEGFTLLRVVQTRRCCPGWCPTACSSSSRSPTRPGAVTSSAPAARSCSGSTPSSR